MNLESEDLQNLALAVELLEHPGLAARLTGAIGMPIEKALTLLPEGWAGAVHEATRAAIERALRVAVATLRRDSPGRSAETAHKLMSGVSGAVGGFFGVPALVVELPVSTAIMLRSIAAIARAEGEDLDALPVQLACLEVFALGGRSLRDDATETGYYAVRAGLANAVSDAARYLARYGLATENAPVVVRLVQKVAARFGVAVSGKVAAQAVPIAGALGGASVNLMFIDHFQDVARGHFIVRRLERRYGKDMIRAQYERLRSESRGTLAGGREEDAPFRSDA